MSAEKRQGLFRSLLELLQVSLFLLFMLGLATDFLSDPAQEEAEQQEQRPQPQPEPLPLLTRLKLRPPPPVPQLVEGADPRQGDVVILPSEQRQPSSFFHDTLSRKNKNRAIDRPLAWWDGPEQRVYTMTAMARDQRHHVANSYLLGFAPFATDKLWVPLQTIAARLRYNYDE